MNGQTKKRGLGVFVLHCFVFLEKKRGPVKRETRRHLIRLQDYSDKTLDSPDRLIGPAVSRNDDTFVRLRKEKSENNTFALKINEKERKYEDFPKCRKAIYLGKTEFFHSLIRSCFVGILPRISFP